ncbi:MAG: hypothetical protein IJ914_01725 [Prevotella sp.]|nr:hypothetical protein [Prevotella sp.]
MKKKLLYIFALLCMVAQGALAEEYDSEIDFSLRNEDLVVPSGKHWFIYGHGLVSSHRITLEHGATVTLSSININGDGAVTTGEYAGITCLGDATIILHDGTTNTVKGFYREYPGILAAKNVSGVGAEYTLTIKGTGTLNVSSNNVSAIAPGIGGPAFGSCGNIEIQGGNITATGGRSSAGIGCGPAATGSGSENYPSSCGNITISGGNVTATGGEFAAGIGAGYGISGIRSTCGNITITGGTVSATGGNNASGIGGSSSYGDCGDITITMDVTSVSATMGAGATKSIGSDKNCGTVTIGGVVYPDGISTSSFTFIPLPNVTSSLTAVNGTMLSGTLANNVKISIADNATVTLRDVSINATGSWTSGDYAGITCLGNATLILKGENSVKGFNASYPGIQPAKRGGDDRYTLTIEGNGSLNASSNGSGAGIGSGCDNIVINSGIINAIGGNNAAGIGSHCYDITINGGTINAIGGTGGAGIGGSCHAITINGGTVTATGGTNAAGIGSGNEESCGDITIANTVTNVTATKGVGACDCIGKGAGVAYCGEVTIGGTECWGWYEGYGWMYNNDGEKYLKCNSLVYLKANADGNGNYWTTYYSNMNHYQAPSGTQVFKAMLDGSMLTLGKIESGIVNSDEGVVLKSTSPNYLLTSTTSSQEVVQSYDSNSLVGTMTTITNPGYAYVLSKGSAGIGFYKLSSSGTIGAHKAYLSYSGAAAREFFSFEEITGIKTIANSQEPTADNHYFDLQGRMVAQPGKGLYIVNGKKVMVE